MKVETFADGIVYTIRQYLSSSGSEQLNFASTSKTVDSIVVILIKQYSSDQSSNNRQKIVAWSLLATKFLCRYSQLTKDSQADEVVDAAKYAHAYWSHFSSTMLKFQDIMGPFLLSKLDSILGGEIESEVARVKAAFTISLLGVMFELNLLSLPIGELK